MGSKTVHIESNRRDAHVFADSVWIGTVAQSPFSIGSQVEQIIVVQRQIDVWNGTSIVFDLGPGQDITLRATFDENDAAIAKQLVSVGMGIPVRNRKWISLAAAGTSIAAGVLAIHFRTKADNRFEDYLETGSPALKRRVQRLDVQSGIALGAMQVGVGVIAFRMIF